MTDVTSVALEPAPDIEPPEALRYDSDWEDWFAWRPVRLYMTGRIAWLRVVHRRNVSRCGIATCDYTDQPDQFATPGFDG
jgi:hypothetical protein